MQYLVDEPQVLHAQQKRRRTRLLLWTALGGIALLLSYSAIFHWLMAHEGESHDWGTGLYWTITTMSTLGYGDITFDSVAGRLFSMVVLVSGVLLILVLLPYLFIQFVVTPWIAERDRARAPRRVPENLRGHILLVGLDTVNRTLIARAKRAKTPTVVLVDDPAEAGRLKDEGYQTMVGALDSPATYRAAGVDRALMVVSTQADTTNTNVAFTVRAVSDEVLITVTADKKLPMMYCNWPVSTTSSNSARRWAANWPTGVLAQPGAPISLIRSARPTSQRPPRKAPRWLGSPWTKPRSSSSPVRRSWR